MRVELYTAVILGKYRHGNTDYRTVTCHGIRLKYRGNTDCGNTGSITAVYRINHGTHSRYLTVIKCFVFATMEIAAGLFSDTEDTADAEDSVEQACDVDHAKLTKPQRASDACWDVMRLYADHAVREAQPRGKGAHCLVCCKDFTYKGSSGNLGRHAKQHTEQARLEASTTNRPSNALTMAINASAKMGFHKQLIKWIVQTYQPLSCVESDAFIKMCQSLNPNGRVLRREEVVSHIAELEKAARAAVLEAVADEHIALTSDVWQSGALKSFVSLTCSWLTADFQLRNLPLECAEFGGSHTGERILEKLKAMLARNGISEQQVTAYVIDNGANMQKAGRLAAFDCNPCAPHTLQLTINKVIESDDAYDALRAARKVVGAFKHSALRCEQLAAAQIVADGKARRLVQDVATRWSSKLAMMESLVKSKTPVQLILEKIRKESPSAAKATPDAAPTAAPAAASESTAASAAVTAAAAAAAPARAPTASASAAAARLAAYGADYEGVVKRTRTSLGAVAAIYYAESDCYSSSDDGSVDEDEPRSSEVEDNCSGEESDVEVTHVVRGRGRASTRGVSSRGRGGRGGGQGKSTAKAASTSTAAGSSESSSSGSSNKSSKAQQAAKRKCASARAKKPAHLTDAQWDLIEMLCELLKPFAAVQKALEGEKYITSSWLPYHIAS